MNEIPTPTAHRCYWQPWRFDVARRRIIYRCGGCGRRRKVAARRCPDCDTGAGPVVARDDCPRGCFRGYLPDERCRCCGAPAKYLCDECKADPAHTERRVYIASLRCAVREAAEVLAGETQEAWGPGSTLAPRNGHSEECWARLPHEGVDAGVQARCPKCSAVKA